MKKKKNSKKPRADYKWIVLIFVVTVFISAAMSYISSGILDRAGMAVSFLILIVIIFIGIIFDIIGVAVTSASETPFLSMASKKVSGAHEALSLLRNAERVSSFCNDVIGDICGVISGSAAAIIAARVVMGVSDNNVADLLLSALVSGLTVGGKAFGKSFAIGASTKIVFLTARFIRFFKCSGKRQNRKK
ncbi:MAG: hypothetical protein IIV87_00190 [Oscillospiraceae bacterium]|nr:hypothetical protein [Oscillospiraceae bacterium]MBQ5748548.1 hypothetical protein [Oscillospiraceae bacterium]